MPLNIKPTLASSTGKGDTSIATTSSWGVAKTTRFLKKFLHVLTGKKHGLRQAPPSKSINVSPLVLQDPQLDGERVALFDNPALHGTDQPDSESFEGVSDSFGETQIYSNDLKPSNFHAFAPITKAPPTSISYPDRQICFNLGDLHSPHNVVLVTINETQATEHVERSSEVEPRRSYWRELISPGAHLTRFRNPSVEGLNIVNKILENHFPVFQLHFGSTIHPTFVGSAN